jgi:hypothetical protein
LFNKGNALEAQGVGYIVKESKTDENQVQDADLPALILRKMHSLKRRTKHLLTQFCPKVQSIIKHNWIQSRFV